MIRKPPRVDIGSLCSLSTMRAPKEDRLSSPTVSYPATQNCVYLFKCGNKDKPCGPECTNNCAELNLLNFCGETLALSFPKKKFSSATARFIDHPAIQASRTSKVMIMGASSIERTLCGAHHFLRMLRYLGINAGINNLVLCNRVCNANCGFPIDIEKFKTPDQLAIVEPFSSFPAILYVMPSVLGGSSVTLLIFRTGNINFMGLRTFTDKEAQQIFENIMPILQMNKAQNIVTTADMHTNINNLRQRIKQLPVHVIKLLQNPESNVTEITKYIEDTIHSTVQKKTKKKKVTAGQTSVLVKRKRT